MVTAVFILVAVGGLFWLAYRRPRPRRWLIPRRAGAYAGARAAAPAEAAVGSAVDRQHRHLQAGGRIGETTFEAARARLADLLAAGRAAEAEGELRAGLGFAVQVRALAEIAPPEAGGILERQLDRTLTGDPAEQAWYWVDVAAALRGLNHTDALPAVLRCADAAAGTQQGVVLSAEAVAFPNFPAALHALASPAGRLAVRALARAARGGRDGVVDVAGLVRAGLGDHLAAVGETAPPASDPWLTAAVLEAERAARRAGHWARLLAADARPLAERQGARLATSAARRRGWLSGAARRLAARFPTAPADEQVAALRCLDDMRADVTHLFPELPDRRAAWWADAVRCLRWSRARATGPLLAGLAARSLGSKRGGAAEVVCGALRGHRCREAEAVLRTATGSRDPLVRRAALGGFGWWDAFDVAAVVAALHAGRADPDPGVRRAAVAALARLGERAALREYSAAFTAEDAVIRRLAVLTAAEEGVSWVWPDLDAVADAADPETALAAAEALERMREHLLGLAG